MMETNYLLEFIKEIKISLLVLVTFSIAFVITLENFSQKEYVANWIITNIFQSEITLYFVNELLNRLTSILALLTGLFISLNEFPARYDIEIQYELSPSLYSQLTRLLTIVILFEIITYEILCAGHYETEIFAHTLFLFLGAIMFILIFPCTFIFIFFIIKRLKNNK